MRKRIGRWLWILAALFVCFPTECFADLKSSEVLVDSQWTLLTEYKLENNTGNLQSLCTTDTYIVCLIDASKKTSAKDTLVAFYKGGSDAEGNRVEPYSVAMTVKERDYEHGNGMTFNPKTREIIICGGKNLNPENKGCVFIVDADTLKFKRKVKITDEWNVHAIAYSEMNDHYLIQKGGAGDYEFVEADPDFHITHEMTEMIQMGHSGEAKTFQDLCICGDDIISLPYNKEKKYNGNIQVYSRKDNKFLGEYQLALASDSKVVESESISELYPGSFVLGCALRNPRRIALYGAVLPMTYGISTSIDQGTITESAQGLDLGKNYTVEWQNADGYETESIVVDGEVIDVSHDTNSYTFYSLTDNHTFQVTSAVIPQFAVTTSAEHGTIDQGSVVNRGETITLNYQPDLHYELEQVLVNGKPVNVSAGSESVTITDIQQDSDVKVIFQELPQYTVTVEEEGANTVKSSIPIYKDEDLKLALTPHPDYELTQVFVDGLEQQEDLDDEVFVLKQITEDHHVRFVYRWKYRVLFWSMAAGIVLLLVCYAALVVKRRDNIRKKRIERNIWMEEMKEIRGESENE